MRRLSSVTLILFFLSACETVTEPTLVDRPGPMAAESVAEPQALPLAGGIIAFVSARDADPEVYLMNADGSSQTRLTSSPGYDLTPALSPDGTKIAFSSFRDGNWEIYLMNTDGSGLTNLTHSSSVEENDPSWSPDGSRLAFTAYASGVFNSSNVFVMNSDGSGRTQVSSVNNGVAHPDWSPDEARIAFASQHASVWDIYVINVNGTGLTNLTNSNGAWAAQFPRWSRDGTKIAFGRFGDSAIDWDVFVMQSNGSNLVNLTNHAGDDFGAVWSPDGSKLAFSSERDGNYEVYQMNPDGTGATRLTVNSADDNAFSWARKVLPLSSGDCMNGGWVAFGFKNQGQCLQVYNQNR